MGVGVPWFAVGKATVVAVCVGTTILEGVAIAAEVGSVFCEDVQETSNSKNMRKEYFMQVFRASSPTPEWSRAKSLHALS